MAFDYAARDGGHFSRAAERHYRVLRTQALRQILALARNGALKPDWRDTLDTPQRSATAHRIYTDGDLLAIDLRQMDYAAWEPGHESSWRDPCTRTAPWPWPWNCKSPAPRTATRPSPAHFVCDPRASTRSTNAATRDGDRLHRCRLGLSAANKADLSVVARDELGASYRAGLRAGGDDVDWLTRYRDHINRWPAGTMKDIVTARLDSPDYQQHMQTLPDYWR